MGDADAPTHERLDVPDLMGVRTALPPGSVTVTGYAGRGYSMVTDVLGDEVTGARCPSTGPPCPTVW